MRNMAKARILVETIHGLAIHLTEEEISDISQVLLRAIKRIEKENINNESEDK